MTRFFMADPHFGHDSHNGGIIRMMARIKEHGKLFSCIEEHDHHLVDEINSRVDLDDELIILGDFAWDNPGRYRQWIKCKNVKLVLGNHDKLTKSRNVFGDMPLIMVSKAVAENGRDHIKLMLAHHPQIYWDQSHNGWGHLYGHVHSQREAELDMLFPQRRSFDVGVDNIYRIWGYWGPLSEMQVYEYLASRSGHDDRRFYDDYQQQLYLERGLI